MLNRTWIAVALGVVASFALADEGHARRAAEKTISLQDGSIVYVFEDGKMGLENKFGIAQYTKPGTMLKAADGTEFAMVGNEVARLDALLKEGMSNNRR